MVLIKLTLENYISGRFLSSHKTQNLLLILVPVKYVISSCNLIQLLLPQFVPLRFKILAVMKMGRDSSVGIATHYGLDGPGIESRWGEGRGFPHPSTPALGPTQPPVQWVPGLPQG